MVELTKEHDLETLRQISLLLDRENQRLITKTLELTAEVARLRGVSDPTQLQLAVLEELERRRAELFHGDARPSSESSELCPRTFCSFAREFSPPTVTDCSEAASDPGDRCRRVLEARYAALMR
jgi:hypothetical protein